MTPAAAARPRTAAGISRFAILILALTAIAADARAGESLYVIEQLIIAVNSAPAGAGDRVATLKSGDRVEVLAHQGDEAQIQLANGSSGWVKASYLSAELPLQRRLQDQGAELEKLRQEITRLQSRPAASPLPVSPAAQDSRAEVPPGAAVRDPSPFMGSSRTEAKPSWLWVLVCSTATLIVGFLAGWRMLDRRIRRKYGGLRIY